MSKQLISEANSDVSKQQLAEFGLELTNLVCTVDLGREFDLSELFEDLPNSEYQPETSPFLLYRPDIGGDPTIMIPTNGNISIVGSNSVDTVIKSFERLKENLTQLGVEVDCGSDDIVVRNIVLHGDFQREFNLNAVVVGLGLEISEYEPEVFPGLVYRPEGQAVIVLFRSGTFIVTGASSYSESISSLDRLAEELIQLGIEDISRYPIS